MNILALDLGTRCGWALAESGRIESGVQVFDVKRGESPGMRYLRFNRWLADLYMTRTALETTLDCVVYEQTHNRGGAATEVAAGFATRVQEFCASRGIQHAAAHSATLKKFATGRGNADKAGMARAAKLRGWTATDDNEIDARWLLDYALVELVPGGLDDYAVHVRAAKKWRGA